MIDLLDSLVARTAEKYPDKLAIKHKHAELSYRFFATNVDNAARGLKAAGLERNERVGIYLSKRVETVTSFFASTRANGVFVPINPLLKAFQVGYILNNCNVRILVTSKERYGQLIETLAKCPDLHTVVLVDCASEQIPDESELNLLSWQQLLDASDKTPTRQRRDSDAAAIFYTSGSTGKPKGVVLSHKNMVVGAKSVASYLNNTSEDKLLAVLPFSFDYGFSQLSTAFYSGASVVLMDYLLPRDVINAIARDRITGLAGIPPLWNQLAQQKWPPEASNSLRYITNSGGVLAKITLNNLRTTLPDSQIYLMYGLTEAFRSTFLPPDEINKRPDSIGKPIPNAEILIVKKNGTPCAPGEHGELIHKGPLVAMGYWNDPANTAKRFKPAPGPRKSFATPEIAVWSGDIVKMDEDGYLYFIGRQDDMIKTSGYRVSPTEIEEVVYSSKQVGEVVALGIPHQTLGQGILIVVAPGKQGDTDAKAILSHCKKALPSFMVPLAVEEHVTLPRTPNGKVDRKLLSSLYQDIFSHPVMEL